MTDACPLDIAPLVFAVVLGVMGLYFYVMDMRQP